MWLLSSCGRRVRVCTVRSMPSSGLCASFAWLAGKVYLQLRTLEAFDFCSNIRLGASIMS